MSQATPRAAPRFDRRRILIGIGLAILGLAICGLIWAIGQRLTAPSAPAPTTATAQPTSTLVPAATMTSIPLATAIPAATEVPAVSSQEEYQTFQAQTQVAEGEVSCTDGKIVAESTRTMDYFLNSDDGDPFNYWVVIAWEASDKNGSMFLSLGQPMKSLDFEAPHILGATYRIEAETLEGATCVSNALAKDFGVTKLLFIGDGNAPDGYSKDFPGTPWKMSTWAYLERPIEPGWDWTDFTVAQDDKSHEFGDKVGYVGLQLWHPGHDGIAWHIVVAPGYVLTSDATQGSGGIGVGGDVILAVKRFLQASVEAETRDQIKTLSRIFCGPADGAMPEGYASDLPDGWSCEKQS